MEIPSLSLQNLTISKEKTYFYIILIFSILIWLGFVFSIFGIIIALVVSLFFVFINGLLIARLRSESVQVTKEQLPELYQILEEVCLKLGLKKIPEMYIQQSHGLLNAFATKFCGKNFVVLNSDLLEAYGTDSPQTRFIIGHEIGHIVRNHLGKRLFLFPGLILPLLAPAYKRACEVSCDRYGVFSSGDIDASVDALLRLAGGKFLGSKIKGNLFSHQYKEKRGFFISLHELISAYPTLSQRVHLVLSLKENQTSYKAPRNPFSYLVGLFHIGTSAVGTIASIYICVLFIGIITAVAVPAIDQAMAKADQLNNLKAAQELSTVFLSKYVSEGKLPQNYQELSDQISNKKFLYEKDGITPKWILHKDADLSDPNSILLENTKHDNRGRRVVIFVSGASKLTKD